MTKPKKKKVPKKKKEPIDFTTGPEYYDVIDSGVVYNEEKRVGKIFGVKEKNCQDKYFTLIFFKNTEGASCFTKGAQSWPHLHANTIVKFRI